MKFSLITTIGIFAIAACGDSTETEVATASYGASFSGLEPLGAGYVYEGWIIVDGTPISTGRFSDPSVISNFETDETPAAYVLTIEPEPDADPGPSDVKVLGGDFSADEAQLSTAHGAALGTDFSNAAGGAILATPTTAADGTDDTNGVWFLDPTGPAASLSLPTLPAGWTYEGWVVGDNGPISTGTFSDPAAADSDGAGPTAGPDAAPPFPGQDFINPAIDVTGRTVVISVEPVPDDSAAPFAIKPLVIDAMSGAVGTLEDFGQNLGSVPSGTVTIQ